MYALSEVQVNTLAVGATVKAGFHVTQDEIPGADERFVAWLKE